MKMPRLLWLAGTLLHLAAGVRAVQYYRRNPYG